MMKTYFPKRCFFVFIILSCLTGCMPAAERTGDAMLSDSPATADIAARSSASYHYSLSVFFALNERLDEAIEELEKALALDSKSLFLATELAALYGEKGNIPKAVSLCETALAENGGDGDTHFLLANLYMSSKNYRKALREYRRVTELEPRRIDALLFMGILYGEDRDYEKALAAFRKLLGIDPDHLMGNYYLAKTLSEMQQSAEAETAYKKTLLLKPLFEPALLDLVRLYEKQDKFDLAVAAYRAFIKINPHSVNIRLKLANLLLKIKHPLEAEQELQATLDWEKGNREVGYSVGLFYLENNLHDRAVLLLQDLLKAYPGDYRLQYLLGSAYEGGKDYPRAIVELQEIPPTADLYPSAQLSIGTLLKNTGQVERAIAGLVTAIENRKDASELYSLLAYLYEENKEPAKAEETLQKGLKATSNVMLRFSLGVLYEKMDRCAESIREMRAVLQMDSNNADAMNFIGYIYADKGINLAEAETLIKKALAIKPGNAYILDSLGWVYFRQNKLEEAIQYLKEAAAQLPHDSTIAEHLGDAYAKAGQISAARKIYEGLMKMKPDNKVVPQKLERLTTKNHDE